MENESKETKKDDKIVIERGNIDILTIKLLNDISLKLAKVIELLEKK